MRLLKSWKKYHVRLFNHNCNIVQIFDVGDSANGVAETFTELVVDGAWFPIFR